MDDVQSVVERELVLLQPAVRRDAAQALALLPPEPVEHGASGRVWDRCSIHGALGGADERGGTADEAPRSGPGAR